MRAAHSVKGAARIVGVEAAVTVAHALEDCFVAAQKGEVTLASGAVDVLLRGVDALQRVVPGDDGGDPPDADALRRLVEGIAAIRAARPPPHQRLRPRPPLHSSRAGRRRCGRRGTSTAPPRRRCAAGWRSCCGGVSRTIRLDFAAVGDVDPDGLALLAVAAREAGRARPPARIRAANATPEVRGLLRLTRLDAAYPLAPEGG